RAGRGTTYVSQASAARPGIQGGKVLTVHTDNNYSRRYSRLCFQHRVERLRWIGELGWIDWHALLDQPARRAHLTLRIDAEHVGDRGAIELEQQRGVVAELAAHTLAWIGDRPAHALDVHVVLLRPVRRQHRIGHVAAGG